MWRALKQEVAVRAIPRVISIIFLFEKAASIKLSGNFSFFPGNFVFLWFFGILLHHRISIVWPEASRLRAIFLTFALLMCFLLLH
jgi:hypothetical protein